MLIALLAGGHLLVRRIFHKLLPAGEVYRAPAEVQSAL